MERQADAILAELARIETKLDHVLEQVRKINGRVGGLENWRHNQEVAEARAEGRSEAVITRGHLAFIGLVLPIVSALIGIISRYFL